MSGCSGTSSVRPAQCRHLPRCSASYKTVRRSFSPGMKKRPMLFLVMTWPFSISFPQTGQFMDMPPSSQGRFLRFPRFPPSDVNTPEGSFCRRGRHSHVQLRGRSPVYDAGHPKQSRRAVPHCASYPRIPLFRRAAGRKGPAPAPYKGSPAPSLFRKTGNS